jgi:hypothetical protein
MSINTPSSVGHDLARRGAAIFRALGAHVEREVSLAGSLIDLLVREQSASGTTITTAVEFKEYQLPVGVDVVAAFMNVSYFLKQRNLIDRAMIVSTSGFTRRARELAKGQDIELLEIADLEQKVAGMSRRVIEEANGSIEESKSRSSKPSEPRAFVVMPFAPEFGDVYILGIREVAERLKFVVERADDIEHNQDIIEVVREKIRNCDVVIADITGRNPNVLYEVGYAHGVGKTTILIGRKGEDIPFDIKSINHIFYESIVELRDKLEKRVKCTVFVR